MLRRGEELLATLPFLVGMREEHLALIAGCAANVGFEAGDALFREGDAADAFYVIRRGSVAIELHAPARGALTVDTVEAGGVVGWSWLFPPYRWHFDGRALTAVRATAFDGACLRGKCEEDAELGYELMKRFAQVFIERLRWSRFRLLDVYGDGA